MNDVLVVFYVFAPPVLSVFRSRESSPFSSFSLMFLTTRVNVKDESQQRNSLFCKDSGITCNTILETASIDNVPLKKMKVLNLCCCPLCLMNRELFYKKQGTEKRESPQHPWCQTNSWEWKEMERERENQMNKEALKLLWKKELLQKLHARLR